MNATSSASDPVTVAVMTGGHTFDVRNFHRLFRTLEGIDAYIQHLDDFTAASEEARDGYDVALFYTVDQDPPSDEGKPWYAGKPRTALEHLGETGQGILVLHHAVLCYQDWDVWNDVMGMTKRDLTVDYVTFNATFRVKVANPNHPITEGLSDWEMVDELYLMGDPDEGNDILLTTDDERSMKSLAWAREHKKSRGLFLQSGHDDQTWSNESFRHFLRRAILWCAHRI